MRGLASTTRATIARLSCTCINIKLAARAGLSASLSHWMNLILERSRRDHSTGRRHARRRLKRARRQLHAGLPRSPPQGNALTELIFSWKMVCVLCGSGRVAVSGSRELELDLELPARRVVLSSPLETPARDLHKLLDLLRAHHHRDESRPGRLALPRLWQPQLARVHFTTTTARPELPLNGRIAGPTQGETISV